jgi:hypothetical protein
MGAQRLLHRELHLAELGQGLEGQEEVPYKPGACIIRI